VSVVSVATVPASEESQSTATEASSDTTEDGPDDGLAQSKDTADELADESGALSRIVEEQREREGSRGVGGVGDVHQRLLPRVASAEPDGSITQDPSPIGLRVVRGAGLEVRVSVDGEIDFGGSSQGVSHGSFLVGSGAWHLVVVGNPRVRGDGASHVVRRADRVGNTDRSVTSCVDCPSALDRGLGFAQLVRVDSTSDNKGERNCNQDDATPEARMKETRHIICSFWL